MESFFWPYSATCSKALSFPYYMGDFSLDKDMIFAEGNYGALVEVMNRFAYGHSCLVMTLSSDREIMTKQGAMKLWQLSLYILFNRYGERGAWPLPNLALKDEFRASFPDDYKEVTERHQDYLMQAWHKYLINNSNKRARASWSHDDIRGAFMNQPKGANLFPEPFFQYMGKNQKPRLKKRK